MRGFWWSIAVAAVLSLCALSARLLADDFPAATIADQGLFSPSDLPGVTPDVQAAAAPQIEPVLPPVVLDPNLQPAQYELVVGPPDSMTEPVLKSPVAPEAAGPKYPSIEIHGAFQADGVIFSQDDANQEAYGDIDNGADFRRARIGAQGAIAVNMNYFFQLDFGAVGRPTFTDVWVEWTDMPLLGNLRIGQWKHPFSLEVVSSYRYTTFMERSVLFNAFTPFRHIGIGAYDHSDDLLTTWAVSLLRTGQDQFGNSISDDGGNGLAGRLTHLLWYDEASEGRSYFHIGGGYFLNAPPHHTARFRTIPEMFVGEHAPNGVGTSGQAVPGVLNGTPFFVDTGGIPGVEHVHTFGVEALWVAGPLSVQSEGMTAVVDRDAAATASFSGGYVQAGWFLTGEHRPYDRASGAISRVIPFEDFFWVNTAGGREYGLGAWELAARWSYIDLNDQNILGGSLTDLTFGVNWYCNPYCKLVFNTVHSWAEAPRDENGGEATSLALRAQVDF